MLDVHAADRFGGFPFLPVASATCRWLVGDAVTAPPLVTAKAINDGHEN
jgi:hypothetical protein